MSSAIQEISLTTITHRTGFRGRKQQTDEAICLKTAGSSIYLRKSAVEDAGNSWKLLTRRLQTMALEKSIPFSDQREDNR